MRSKKQTAVRETTTNEEFERKLIRVSKEVMGKIKTSAKRDHRSINAQVICALEAFVEARK